MNLTVFDYFVIIICLIYGLSLLNLVLKNRKIFKEITIINLPELNDIKIIEIRKYLKIENLIAFALGIFLFITPVFYIRAGFWGKSAFFLVLLLAIVVLQIISKQLDNRVKSAGGKLWGNEKEIDY